MQRIQKLYSTNSFDPDTLLYINKVEAVEGLLPVDLKRGIDSFVRYFKANGLWSRAHFLHVAFAQTLAGNLIPLKSDAALNITNIGATGFSNYHYHPINGTFGRYNQDAYYNTQYNLGNSAAITLSNLSLIVNKQFTSVNVASTVLGVNDGTNEVSLKLTANITGKINNKTINAGASTAPAFVGLIAVVSDGTVRMINNGVQKSSSAGVPTGSIPTLNFPLFSLNTSGVYSGISDASNGIDFTLIGEAYTLAETVLIQTALTNLRTAQQTYYRSISTGINCVMQYGQSLSVGAGGAAVLSTTPSTINKMLNTGALPVLTGFTGLSALVEASAESGVYSFAETITDTYPNHAIVTGTGGQGGIAYSGLRKDGTYFGQQFYALFNAMRSLLYTAGSQRLNLRAVNFIHGESDDNNSIPNYDTNMATLQSDIQTYLDGGIQSYVPLIQSQTSAWTKFSARATPIVAPLQVVAAETAWTTFLAAIASNPSALPSIVVCTPKYIFTTVADGTHLVNTAYRWLLEYHAKAYRALVILGNPWTGLRVNTVNRVANVITVNFFVPVGPLQFDTTQVTDNTGGNKGFEFFVGTAGNSPTISSVAIVADLTTNTLSNGKTYQTQSVTITLSATPTGTAPEIRYAWTGTANNSAGPTTGARGNLCDTDATVSRYGNDLRNWCHTFNKVV